MEKNFDFSAMILIFLKNLNISCSEELLAGCMECAGFGNNFEFSDCTQDLVQKSLVQELFLEGKKHFEIMHDGISVCKEIEELYLADSSKKRALDDAISYYEAIKTGLRYICEVTEENGMYKMNFTVTMSGNIIADANLFFAGKEVAYKARDYCRSHKENVFNNLSAVLSGELDIFSM